MIEIWNFIKIEINKITKNHVPPKLTSSKFHQPFTKIKRLIRKKNRWFQRAKASKTSKVWETYKNIKRETQKACRQAHDQYLNNIFTEDCSNKQLWTYTFTPGSSHSRGGLRSTRPGGGELAYNRPNSAVDSQKFSFFPSTINLWIHFPARLKSCNDTDNFNELIKSLNLITNLKYGTSAPY